MLRTDALFFLEVWKHVKDDGRYRAHDFTIKVSPDVVFLPGRLQMQLSKLGPPAGDSLYIKTLRGSPGVSAKFMIFSRVCLIDYFWHELYCSQHIDHAHGEAAFWEKCMDAIGVTHMMSQKLFLGGLNVTAECARKSSAAFHPV